MVGVEGEGGSSSGSTPHASVMQDPISRPRDRDLTEMKTEPQGAPELKLPVSPVLAVATVEACLHSAC